MKYVRSGSNKGRCVASYSVEVDEYEYEEREEYMVIDLD